MARVRSTGRRIRGGSIEIRYVASVSGQSRFGIIVPRHQNTAVSRNRVKRRLREILRNNVTQFRGHAIDLVVFAFPRAYAASFDELRKEWLVLYGQVGKSQA